ncbi:2-Amino-4-Hydroxy-6-Hydroxymethyldihydropteridine pyrophosphokinase [Arthrobacter sp. Hiyo4]|nr:2-Amino-4-Hydroxy-6-Hydroxymethyldihydropteridine pyrophosphokinase [Arthrobacter sp. Hiyo4]
MSAGYTKAVLALGSNLGERNDTLSEAVADLVDPPEVRLQAVSRWCRLKPWVVRPASPTS